jgi:hypothetical protein
MSNTLTKEYCLDAEKLIRFIGSAYALDDELTNACVDYVLNTLSRLGRTTDQQALYAERSIEDAFTDLDSLFDIKGDVLLTLQRISSDKSSGINSGLFDYSHYKTYQADIRYSKLETAGATGNLIVNRQLGLLNALGIGCEKNLKYAIARLTQCAYWGDIPAMRYLTLVCKLNGDDIESNIWREVATLSQEYLRLGVTVLPAEVKTEYSASAVERYACISSILQDVVYGLKQTTINFSFIEAITMPKLSFYDKMALINGYEHKLWKEVTNSSAKPKKSIGF